MMLDTHIVALEYPPSRLHELAAICEGQPMILSRVTSSEELFRLLAEEALISAVVVDERMGVAMAHKLVADLRALHPALAIWWVATQSQSTPEGAHKPNLVLHFPFNREEFLSGIRGLLSGQFFPEGLVEQLKEDCLSVLNSAYGLDSSVGRAILKVNRRALGESNAVLPFCGKGITGRLVLSTATVVLKKVYRKLLPSEGAPSDEDSDDLAGELANLLTGRAKAYFASKRLHFELGVPVLLGASDLSNRPWASKPTMVLPIDAPTGKMFVSLYFDSSDGWSQRGADQAAPSDSGKIRFF